MAGLLFQLDDLVEPSLVAAAFEFGFHPDLDEPLRAARAEQIARQAKHVQIVVAAA